MRKNFMCLLILFTFLAAQSEAKVSSSRSSQEAFMKIARAFVEKHILPDGERIDKDELLFSDFSNNEIAVCDVDNDGRQELLIRFKSGSMVSQREFICGFNRKTGRVRIKFTCFPATEYFSNGCIKELTSHNHGLAGEFWPYSFSKYNSQTGKYEYTGSVDAWSKEAFPTNPFDNNEPFPDKIDVTGDGFVYYIDDENFDKAKDPDSPVDTPVYNEWVNSCIGDAEVININWLPADKEGLKALNKALKDIQ